MANISPRISVLVVQMLMGIDTMKNSETNTGRSFYLVESKWRQQTFIYETDLATAGLDETVRMIADGQYDTGEITTVYRCAPEAGIMEDCTQAVLEQVAAILNRDGTVPGRSLACVLWQNGIELAPRLQAAQ